MPDEIVLPKSGLVLTRDPNDRRAHYYAVLPIVDIYMIEATEDSPTVAIFNGIRSPLSAVTFDSIQWLDSRAVALRAALMPPDARERVVSALSDARLSHMAGTMKPMPRTQGELSQRLADAVLTALGIAP